MKNWALIFLIWPFGAFLLKLYGKFDSNSKFIIYAFAFIFGYNVVPTGHDISSYKIKFEAISNNYQINDLLLKIGSLYSDVSSDSQNSFSKKPDIYADVIAFLTITLSSNVQLFWGIVSLIYTILFVKVLEIAIKRKRILYEAFQVNAMVKYAVGIIMLSLVFVIPFSRGVAGVRFWTAYWLFIYAVLRIDETPKRNYSSYFYVLLTPLIHYTYIFPLVLFLLAKLRIISKVRNNSIVLIFLMVIVITLSQVSFFSTSLASVFEGNSDAISGSASSYLTEDRISGNSSKGSSAVNWYVSLNYYGFQLVIGAMYLLLLVFGRIRSDSYIDRLTFLFFLIFLITIPLNVTYHRFNYIFISLVLFECLKYFSSNVKLIYRGVFLLAPFVLLRVLVHLRVDLYFLDVKTTVGNVFFLLISDSYLSVSEFLIGH
jgi:hypothetical protein